MMKAVHYPADTFTTQAHLQTSNLIRHTNVNLTVKATEAAEGCINGVGPAGNSMTSNFWYFDIGRTVN
jgi:hypothetical protein